MAKILLTGGSGFLGRYALHTFLKLGAQVLVPTRHPRQLGKLFGRQFRNLEIVKGIFYDPTLIERYKEFQPDFIVHLAAIRGEGNGKWRDYYEVNVKGTEILVQFALEHPPQKFLYCSTVGVFGTIPARLPADPWTPAEPDSLYHKSKYLAENYVVNELRNAIPLAIVRPTITYGAGDTGFIARMATLVQKRLFPLVRGSVKIHLLDVHTFARALPIILNASAKEIFINLADKHPVYLREVVDVMYRYFHGKHYPHWRRVPKLFYTLGKSATRLTHMNALTISLRLISESWYYDTSHMEQLKIPQINTLEGIGNYLKKVFPK